MSAHNFKFATMFLKFKGEQPTLHVSYYIKDDVGDLVNHFGKKEQPGDSLIDLEYFLENFLDAEYTLRQPDAKMSSVGHDILIKHLRENDSIFLLRLGQFLSIKTRFGYATIWSVERDGHAHLSWRLTPYQYPQRKTCDQLWQSHINKWKDIRKRPVSD